MYATSANMPHVTSPEFNSRVIYQRGQLQNSSVASVGNFHDSSMNYFNYPNMQSYPGEFQSNSVPLPVGVQRSNTMDDRSSSNYPNLPTSRNPFANSVSNSHEYYALENMDNRESLVCQQSISQGQSSGVRRINRSPFESSAGRKSRSWTDAVFASMDREAESILELVNEDAMELERIAATIKQDCKSPNSATDNLLTNDYGSIALPSVAPINDLSYSRWNRPQFTEINARRKRSPRPDQHYLPDDYVLSSDFQTFSLDSPPGQDFRYGDLYGLPNPVGQFSTNPNLGGYVRNSFPQQASFLSDLQTYHGANTYSSYRQNFVTDNIRTGSEVMLGEASRSYYKPCSRERIRTKHGESHDDLKRTGDSSNFGSKSKHKGEARSKMCLSDEYKGILGKRKADQSEDHNIQHKKQKFYFEREDHYVVHKLLRELSSANAPSELPRTTSASLFYRLLSSKAEPRIMQTVGGTIANGRSRKVVVRDDVSEDQIGRYSHVGSHPFIYIHGAASRASPTKSLKLIELLTKKPPVSKEEENIDKKESINTEEKPEENNEGGNQGDGESTSDPIR